MAGLDNEKYRLLVDSLVANYVKQFGGPPKKEKEMDAFTEGIFAHYVNNSDGFTRFFNRIPVDLRNIKIVDRTGRALFIDIRKDVKDREKQPGKAGGKKRTIRWNGSFEPRQIGGINRYAFYLLLRHDFKESARRQNLNGIVFSGPSEPFEAGKNKKRQAPAGGSLEKDFKALIVKSQAVNVLSAAKIIINRMQPAEREDLITSLKSSGIQTQDDLRGLLHKWKGEALTENRERRKEKPERTRARNLSRGPVMGL
jgi:hypothetical protein